MVWKNVCLSVCDPVVPQELDTREWQKRALAGSDRRGFFQSSRLLMKHAFYITGYPNDSSFQQSKLKF